MQLQECEESGKAFRIHKAGEKVIGQRTQNFGEVGEICSKVQHDNCR